MQLTTSHRDWATALQHGTGRGVRVGLLDTGVDSRHPALAGKIAANYQCVLDVPDGSVIPRQWGEDPNEHGSACAGILARLAPDAEIHSVQIVEHARDTHVKLIAGFRFAVEQGWEVINISAGSGTPHPQLRELADAAWEAGQIVIAAKDNRPGITGYPAAFPNVLAVDMEHFSDPLAIRFSPDGEAEVQASGVYIDAPVAGGGWAKFTGTSYAAPHVAAIAARLKQLVPELDGTLFRTALAQLSTERAGNKGS